MGIEANRLGIAYAQASIEMKMYMELPVEIKTKHGDIKSPAQKYFKNLYSLQQASLI